jgi:phospholipid transport system transporter-binding protein
MTDNCVIEVEKDGHARLSGELTFESVPGLYLRAQKIMSEDLASIDLLKVTRADSAGLSLLLEWQASRNDQSSMLQFTNAPSSLMSLASLCEATDLLNISGR